MNAPVLVQDPQPVKLTIEDFELLLRANALDRYGRVELIEGVIVAMSPQLSVDVVAKSELGFRLRDALIKAELELVPLIEATIAIPTSNLPDPDIALVERPWGDGYIPLSAVRLIVEVANTSVDHDLGVKSAMYARNGVPEYWVVDLPARLIYQFASPNGDVWSQKRRSALGTQVSALTIAGLSISTDNLV